MKTRIDFVTNSSSSSFILAYNNEREIIDKLNKLRVVYGNRNIDNAIELLERAEEVSFNYIQLIAEEEIADAVETVVWFNLMGNRHTPADSFEDIRSLDEFSKLYEDRLNKFLKKVEGKSVFKYFEVGDSEYPILEHDIFPRLAVAWFSHH